MNGKAAYEAFTDNAYVNLLRTGAGEGEASGVPTWESLSPEERQKWSFAVADALKSPGQRLYEAYFVMPADPPWGRVSADVRANWEAAAEAATGPQTIEQWQRAIHEYACSKGWWDNDRSFGDICSLIHSEVTEAFEEHRNGHALDEVYANPEKPGKLEGVPVELADVVIRILDFAQWAGIDLQGVMSQKHAFNLTRPYRHGGKKV